MHQFEVTLTPEIAKVALLRFLYRSRGSGVVFGIAMLVAVIAYDFSQNEFSTSSVAATTILFLLPSVFLGTYFTRCKQFKAQLERIGDEPIIYSFTEDHWSVKSKIGNAEYNWSMIVKLWIDSDLLFIFYNTNAYVTIPMNQIPSESLEFLIAQVKSISSPIVDRRKS